MVLRINFTGEDLARVRVTPDPDPLWELVLSVTVLVDPAAPEHYQPWRREILARISENEQERRDLHLMRTLVPNGNFLDLLTPAHCGGNLEAGLDRILGTPKKLIRDDVLGTFQHIQAPPRWAREVMSGNPERLREIAAILRRYHDMALAPAHRTVAHRVQLDRGMRAVHLMDDGVDGLLGNLHHSIRWHGRTLEADYPYDHAIDLAGRGLTLVPTHFCWGGPITLINGDLAPVLVYPADGSAPATRANVHRLAGLLGRTRAKMLADLHIPRSTGQLAGQLRISPSAVSQHVAVLRQARLIDTTRTGPSVRHTLTPLGRDLLAGDSSCWKPRRT